MDVQILPPISGKDYPRTWNDFLDWFATDEACHASPTYRRSPEAVKLSPFHAAVEQALKVDAHRNKQNRRTAKALFAQIKADGYVGGYSQLTAFIRDWRGKEGKAPHAFVPLKFDLGEAFQFDWSEEGLVIGGIYRRMQVPEGSAAGQHGPLRQPAGCRGRCERAGGGQQCVTLRRN